MSLSGDKLFLEKAEDLGERMLKAFDSPSGLPYGQVSLNSDESSNLSWLGTKAILAEIGTLQLEFRYLGKRFEKLLNDYFYKYLTFRHFFY